ncbi:hypothetical protein [Chryseobacterium binzhouense]|uniref:hypothetical protein n=1 Tax=Chryseobacterium binzhouense TaxID=2593646 RepID=UPI00289B44D7|nr:hypothetical protein [Chryseobacterium binzhouense]
MTAKKLIQPIFSEAFLQNHIHNFHLSSIPNIRQITVLINSLISELESGKLASLKEEEIKSRFVSVFFGDILGFNYGNSTKWLLKEEKKSTINGTKPDAALGYFFIDDKKDDVRAVIELKDASSNLDDKQNRPNKMSPVEQAFNYSSQMGRNCKWVIVSNIKEIRFYTSSDRSTCQVFQLIDLKDENKLKELLFLFHKDKFIKFELDDKSNTDKLLTLSENYFKNENPSIHIIDKIYHCLIRFKDLGFVSPDYLASIKPFNVLKEYVWHYHDQSLFTNNPEIYQLLSQITIENDEIIFSEILQAEIFSSNVLEAKKKLEWSFQFLNQCLISEITAVKDYKLEKERNKNVLGFSSRQIHNIPKDNHIKSDINLTEYNYNCNCVNCTYRNFDFDGLIRKLKKEEGNKNFNNLEYAFGNFLLSSNNYKTSFTILKNIQDESKTNPEDGVKYFMALYNMTLLYNLLNLYDLDDKEDMKEYIRNIDLDKTIYNDLEFYIEKDVLNYLKKIKNENLLLKTRDQIEEISDEILDLQKLDENGGSMTMGPNYTINLIKSYKKLFNHIYSNHTFDVKFSNYQKVVAKFFEALLISYNTPKYGLISFDTFIITEAILNIPPASLKVILKDQNALKADTATIKKVLKKLNNLLSSYYENGVFNDPYENTIVKSQLENWNFRSLYTNIFSNSFTILSKIEITKEQFAPLIKSLIAFIKIEDILAWYELKELSLFINVKGFLFEPSELEEILSIAIKKDKCHNVKYESLLKYVPQSLIKNYCEYFFANKTLVKKAILNCHSESNGHINYRKLIKLFHILNLECKIILKAAFEEFLDDNFDSEFYEMLLHEKIFDVTEKNYFHLYTTYTNNRKGKGTYRYGKSELTDLLFINYILLIYKLEISFEKEELKLFTNLNSFENWLIHPYNFDYASFDTNWLINIEDCPIILKRLKNIPSLIRSIDEKIKIDYDPILAQIKYQYFAI